MPVLSKELIDILMGDDIGTLLLNANSDSFLKAAVNITTSQQSEKKEKTIRKTVDPVYADFGEW